MVCAEVAFYRAESDRSCAGLTPPGAISWADREVEGRDAVVLENSKELRAEIKRLNQQINQI
jgi:hypothetical protein